MLGHKYPCGKSTLSTVKDDTELLKSLNGLEQEEMWEQRLIQVDVTCPSNLLIAFLMSRNKEGNNIQDLKPKIKKWYTGVELLEAVRLGYKITKIHAYYQWEYYEEIFTSFIEKAWDRKVNSKKDTAPYLIAKTIMNALSGKFGQKSMDAVMHLIIGSDFNESHLFGSCWSIQLSK